MAQLDSEKSWFPFGLGDVSAQRRVFCLPFAGSGASFFLPWRKAVPQGVTLVPVQYPGRETRLNEPCLLELDQLVDELAQVILPYLDRSYVIAGYSLGAKVGFSLAHRLAALGAPSPDLFVAIAHHSPGTKSAHIGAAKLPDDEFRSFLRGYGAMSEQIFEDPELAQMFIPILRADIGLVDCSVVQQPLPCPIIAYAGAQDEIVASLKMQDWQRFTSDAFDLRCFKGGHFFTKNNDEFLSTFAQDITHAEIICHQ
jgi:surfactin synthase thioesterase subunit